MGPLLAEDVVSPRVGLDHDLVVVVQIFRVRRVKSGVDERLVEVQDQRWLAAVAWGLWGEQPVCDAAPGQLKYEGQNGL